MRKKRIFLAVCAVSMVIGVFFLTNNAFSLPDGSYQQTCKNCTDDGNTLRCDCSYKGKFKSTSLAYKICESGQIWNDKSKLRCTPQGSFKRSCSNISWNENFLTAICKRIQKGKTIPNSGFNYNACINNGQDITNCDGSLRCGGCN
ncbi:MAG: hypothetical protein NTU69_01080 [Proteobacteria bacterium]|nr:hypothetical protein [Pseudomonadota bacterium]